jgi:guanylate kinase
MWGRPFPLILSGPSGAGKTTVARAFVDRVPGTWLSVSATTRAPRAGEVEGVDYHFLARDEFDRLAASGNFLEWALVHDHAYGTPREPVEERLRGGWLPLLAIDVQGGLRLKAELTGPALIFLAPPDLATLEERLRGRGSDAEEVIRTRLRNALVELEQVREYDYLVVNRTVDQAVEDITRIVQSEVRRTTRLGRGVAWDDLLKQQGRLF